MQIFNAHYESAKAKVEIAFLNVEGKAPVAVTLTPEEAMAVALALKLAMAVKSIAI